MDAQKESVRGVSRRCRMLVRAIVGGLCIFGLLLIYVSYRGLTDVELVENAPRGPDWLPSEARNVCYYRSYPFTAFEFDIPEKDFRRWAEERGWPLSPVTGKPATILRYARATNKAESSVGDDAEAWASATQKTIASGYFYEHRQNNGGGVAVGYDADTGRGYFQSNPR